MISFFRALNSHFISSFRQPAFTHEEQHRSADFKRTNNSLANGNASMASCSHAEPAVPIGHKGIKKRNFFSKYRSCSPVRVREKKKKRQIRPVLPAVGRNWSQWVRPALVERAGGRQKGPLDLGVARPTLDASRKGIWALAPQEGGCLPL